MLRVAQHVERTDTGRQRRSNEDAYFARSPLFAVADGMGGAQAGEVASHTATEVLQKGLPDGPGSVGERLAGLVQEANDRIHKMARGDSQQAGMGTTLTAAYVGEDDVTIVHVGDSRLYRLRDGEFMKLTEDHSLVAELERQGKITSAEAQRHPQRSIITRALGPEPDVEVDQHTWPAQDGDVYLICSDGLLMFEEERVGDILREEGHDLRSAARSLINEANDAGGRDNITVVLFRLEDVGRGPSREEQATKIATPVPKSQETRIAASPTKDEEVRAADDLEGERRSKPRTPRPPKARVRARRRPSRWRRRLGAGIMVLALIIVPVVIGVSIALRSVYFIGTDADGFVAVYQGLPYDLPAGVHLYHQDYVSGVSAAALPTRRRSKLLDHKLRSHDDANDLVKQLELGQIAR